MKTLRNFTIAMTKIKDLKIYVLMMKMKMILMNKVKVGGQLLKSFVYLYYIIIITILCLHSPQPCNCHKKNLKLLQIVFFSENIVLLLGSCLLMCILMSVIHYGYYIMVIILVYDHVLAKLIGALTYKFI